MIGHRHGSRSTITGVGELGVLDRFINRFSVEEMDNPGLNVSARYQKSYSFLLCTRFHLTMPEFPCKLKMALVHAVYIGIDHQDE
jgi:hypothetical protein